ncbi:16S rRNA (cytidine(1402)-2'-O)-methyltransferase [Pseudaestuariivita sp.]|uniref:16S rRNA (cytidine(1402)-2'-O)-methyltransferase n=1 Tax=Pseudaestuariivita sp. TaxID=2211669 RepID=UPI0040585966
MVATPIGNARDITLRALDAFANADMLVAEDTRTLRKLLELHAVPLAGRRITAYHDHSDPSVAARLMEAIAAGKSVVYASDAGTPLVSDPGFGLVRAAREAGHPVTALPGASALLTALAVAGLPTDQFLFHGFLPPKSAARRKALEALHTVPATLVFYESPHRISACLTDAIAVCGAERPAALCRELTKKFEETRTGTLDFLLKSVEANPPRGEIVLLLGPGRLPSPHLEDVDTTLRALLSNHPVKTAAHEVAQQFGLRKRDVYQRALALKGDLEGDTE